MAAILPLTILTVLLGLAVVASGTPTANTTTATTAAPVVVVHEHFGEHNACCLGDNVYDMVKGCIEGDHKIAGCQKMLLDPHEDDVFSSSKDGVHSFDELYENGRFCHANFGNGTDTRQVALVCFEKDTHYDIMFTVKGTLCIVSVLFLIATLYVYYLIPDLRETQDKVTCCALACLLVFLLLLGIVQLNGPDDLGPVCILNGYLIYFFMLAYFSWLNVVMWNVWKSTIMHKWTIKERYWYILNHVYGWGVPICLVIVISQFNAFSNKTCWMHSSSITIFLYFPILAILVVNVVLFAWSAYGIHGSGQDVSPDRKRALAYKFRLYLKLVVLAGFTWFLEVLSFYYSDVLYISWWLIVDVMNALQGLGAFLVLIVFRRRIRKELAGKRILCFHTPASWAAEAVETEECGLQPDSKTHGLHDESEQPHAGTHML